MNSSKNHLRLADQTLEELKSLDDNGRHSEILLLKYKWSMTLLIARAIVEALESIADAIRKAS